MSVQKDKLIQPLVSVIALSYNQSETVLESLESIFSQTYSNIELIICDDASTDRTKEIISSWLMERRLRFVNVLFLSNAENIGISKNLAQGISSATGKWIKPLACDDLLKPKAIENFVSHAQKTGAELIFSQMQLFSLNKGKKVLRGRFLVNNYKLSLFTDPTKLYSEICFQNFLPAPSSFYTKAAYLSVGGIDLRFRNLDDWPLWVKFLEKGILISWIPQIEVNYRISDKSVSQSRKNNIISDFLYSDYQLFYKLYQSKKLKGWLLFDRAIFIFRMKVVYKLFGNSSFAYWVTSTFHFVSPEFWKKVRRRLFQVMDI